MQRLKRQHWAMSARATAGEATVAMGQMLFEHARALRPDFPDAAYLQADLEHHLHLKQLIDRASAFFRR